MNKHIVVGNIVRDLELDQIPANGKKVCNFTVATNEFAGKGKEKHTEYHNCAAFGAKAETIVQYARKGSKIYIEGPVRKKKYTTTNGDERLNVTILVNEFEFLDSKQGSSSTFDSGQSDNSSMPAGGFDDLSGYEASLGSL